MANAKPAAFFDLDRTLLGGASGPVISECLRAVGVLSERSIPGEGLLFKIFDTIGETLPSMLLARQAARLADGWNHEKVLKAGEMVAERLAERIQPYARILIDEHHQAGRKVVMATTSPFDLVSPLAKAIGLDAVIGTRYGVTDGAYDGTIDGHWVWGPGKVAAVREWAGLNDVDVAKSWAYSDSIFDMPLLSAVEHPVAVNPDPRLMVFATLRRWPIQHLDVPKGVPKFAGFEPQRVLQTLGQSQFFPWVRLDVGGTENIPREGPIIVVANHRSYLDSLVLTYTVGRVDRPLRFLGKKEVFDAPVVGQVVAALGGIRVDRGSGSDEPLQAAAGALEAGEAVALFPQGTIPRGRAFFDPELKGRWGAAKLAKLSKATVVPVGMWGAEKAWPRNSRLPDFRNLTDPPTVRIRVGKPVELKHRSLDVDTKRIMDAIIEQLPMAARRYHRPSAAEIARALPAGVADVETERPGHETARRPGSD